MSWSSRRTHASPIGGSHAQGQQTSHRFGHVFPGQSRGKTAHQSSNSWAASLSSESPTLLKGPAAGQAGKGCWPAGRRLGS